MDQQGGWQFPTPFERNEIFPTPFERNEIAAAYSVQTGFVMGPASKEPTHGKGRVVKILLMLAQNKVYQIEMWKAGESWREPPYIPNPLYLRTPDRITDAMRRAEFHDVFGNVLVEGAWRVAQNNEGQVRQVEMPDRAEQQTLLDISGAASARP